MKEKNNVVNYNGVGFFGLLGILFIGLKLAGYIDWSWWWVLLPIYGPIALVLILLLMFSILCIVMAAITKE